MAVWPYQGKWPKVDETAFVHPASEVIGDVALGPGTSVWPGAVLRGDVNYVRVGARTNIQDNVVVHVESGGHPTLIGDGVTIGHAAVVHACTIHDGCLIGMGSIILDGATVGPESFLAAGSLVPPGQVIPTRTLAMGRPAKVVRALGEDDVARMAASARHYQRLAESHRQEVTRGSPPPNPARKPV